MKITLSALAACWLVVPAAHGLDLLEAYQLGLNNDPVVLQSEAKRNAALKNKPIGLSKLLPQLSLYGDFRGYQTTTGKSPIAAQANTDNKYWLGYYNLRLTQPLFHYDSWVQYWQADQQIAQAEATLEADYQNLAVRIAKAYFAVLYAEENVEFTKVELQSLALQLAQVKERLAVGFATVVDQDEAQSQYDKVSADLILAEQQLSDAKEALREIIGPVDIHLARAPEELPMLKPEPADIESWRNTAQQSNLNIMAALSAAEVAKQAIDVNFAGHMPTLDLVATKSNYNNNRPNGVAYDEENVGLALNFPIYSGGGVNARVEQARDLYAQALQEVDKQRRTAERQVKDAYRGVLAAIGRVGALKTALKSGQSALDASQMGYQVGTRTMVDVLVVQSRFFAIRRDYAKARYDYLQNGLLLKQAAGTLTGVDMAEVNALIHDGRPAKAAPAVPDKGAAPARESKWPAGAVSAAPEGRSGAAQGRTVQGRSGEDAAGAKPQAAAP
jgi:outer membrane protein